MAQYFAGGSLAAFTRTTTAVVEATTASRFDSAYTTLSISVFGSGAGGNNDYIQTPTLSVSGTFWTRFDLYVSAINNTGGTAIQMMNGSTGIFRFITASSGSPMTCQGQYWNGSAWTNTGATFTLSAATLYTIVVKVILNTSFELYVGGTLVTSGSGWTGGSTSCDGIRFYGIQNGVTNTSHYSQVMVADYDLRDSKLMSAALNGNSASNTGGTGTYTDINENVLNETTAEAVSVSGNRMGQTKASITVPAGYNIKGMVISGRGRVSGTITNGKFGIRSGGVNYSSSNQNFATAYEPRCYIAAVDPNTGTDFTQTNFNSAETYFEAV